MTNKLLAAGTVLGILLTILGAFGIDGLLITASVVGLLAAFIALCWVALKVGPVAWICINFAIDAMLSN